MWDTITADDGESDKIIETYTTAACTSLRAIMVNN